MSALAPLPTRKDEAWRYSNLEALEGHWLPREPKRFIVPADGALNESLLLDNVDGVDIRDLVIEIGAGGRFGLHLLAMGGALSRVTLDVTLQEGAHFELSGALLGTGEETVELVTRVTHAEPSATSNQTVRAISAVRATTSYLGQVRVARDAQKTDASQSFKAMLLDRGATANAKPELEIFADDVKCAHGASVGELDKAALFYLASRGLDPAGARALMLRAFIAGLFEDMADADERARFEAAALARLEAMA